MTIIGEWLVACERVVRDAETQDLTLQRIVNSVDAPIFPTLHPQFALCGKVRWNGEPPSEQLDLEFRFIRFSEKDGQTTAVTIPGKWNPGTQSARVHTNFQFIKLHRPERVTFRLDYRMPEDDWTPGPSCTVDIRSRTMTGEQLKELVRAFKDTGLEPPKWLKSDADEG